MIFEVSNGKGLSLDEECIVDSPYSDCYCHDNPISVPNGNARNVNEHLISGDYGMVYVLMRTYARKTINREEADIDKKDKT